ncbi:peptidoglycan D,D-transpeptidase FtsI family protein [Neobacillus sp. GCM10023253]|uniref:peptidoglycan D,D-transpeptidase FtsI family protein n=1 Tax=Neobacillus sp. GCM10023253 TaxID=3252644 RepID=UPI00360AF469
MTENKKKNVKLARVNILFVIVFLLFSVLIFRMGVVQIVYGEDYQKEIARTDNITVNHPVPRGEIYDRFGRPIVSNLSVNTISYTREVNISNQEVLKVAQELAKLIDKENDKLTERDLKDYWILTRPEKAEQKLTAKEKSNKDLTNKELYQLQLKRIDPKTDLAEISQEELEVAAIYREMAGGYALTPQIVKNEDVPLEELAVVSENLDLLPGVDVVTDWKREYPNGDIFRSVLGNVTTSKEGLPGDSLDYYLPRGYSRNDRVGKSQIELLYEGVLKGQKEKIQYETDNTGNIISSKVMSEGKPGKDLVLTIDIELQKRVEEILANELMSAKINGGGPFLDRAFVVMLNPKTGEVLSLAGKKLEQKDGKWTVNDYALGTITSSYAMGSAVKGATVLTGFKTGVIRPGTPILDEPLNIQSTPVKKSYTNMDVIDDLTALKRSSNVYMFKTAIKMMGTEYYPNMKLPGGTKVFKTFRYYFNQFGLGVRTGIDLPNEATGLPGETSIPGKALDFAIGQFDTYTPIQLAQYIATIANNGNRIKPTIVKEIHESTTEKELGPVYSSIEPVVLNRIDMEPSHIKRVQEGLRKVYQEAGGTATSSFAEEPFRSYNIAGKTGTAEAFYYDPIKKKLITDRPTYNLTLVGYAPFNDPEIAFSIVVPNTLTDSHPVNKKIGQGILKAYFNLMRHGDGSSAS